jgi:hypothetical protein
VDDDDDDDVEVVIVDSSPVLFKGPASSSINVIVSTELNSSLQ